VLKGIKEAAGADNVVYAATAAGVNVADYKAVIAVIGEKPYSEGVGDIGKTGTLEHAKRYPEDLAVLKAVGGKGVPVVTLLMSGRPVWINREINLSNAVVSAWLPGSEGKGVADVLFRKADGSVNYDFTGRLSFSWPKTACQTTMNRGDADYAPLFAYGYGLNYAATGKVDAQDETLPERGCGQTVSIGPAATDDLEIFNKTESQLHRLYIGSNPVFATLVGTDLNTPTFTTNGKVKVETKDYNVQQDAKKVTWIGDGQFFTQSENIKTDYSGYLSANAALAFDIIVHQAPEGNVKTRIDSKYPSISELDLTNVLRGLTLEAKKTLKIPLSCFANAPNNTVDFAGVDTPFLVFTEKPFAATFANIRWQINAAKDADALTCDALRPPALPVIDALPGPKFTLLDANGFANGFALETYSTSSTHLVVDTTTTVGVLDLNFIAEEPKVNEPKANGVTFVKTQTPINLTNYANGKLTFDLKILDWGTNTGGLAIKMESPGDECRNIDYPLPERTAADGAFYTITLNVADIAANKNKDCFGLEYLNVPFGILPKWDDQQGVRFQVKNIVFSQ
jgi:beta-glucosidase